MTWQELLGNNTVYNKPTTVKQPTAAEIWFAGSTGIMPTSTEGVSYDIDTGGYLATPAPTTPVTTAPKATTPTPTSASRSSGANLQASLYTPPKVEQPEPFRANVKTGSEVGGGFKLFKGGELGDKTGLTADRLRIGSTGDKTNKRDIKKRKQLDTLGLNIAASSVGLGI